MGSYPEGDAVRIGEGEGIGGVDDGVLAHGHGVELDVLGYALGVAGLELESERLDLDRREAKQNGDQQGRQSI